MQRKTKRNLVIVAVGFAAGLLFALFSMRESTEPLTLNALSAARARWQATGVTTYDLHYRMQDEIYHVKAENHIITSVTINGTRARTNMPRMYGIEGIFDILAMDLENMTNPAGPFAGRQNQVLMRVRFHPTLGYVERYLRSSGGVGRAASIELIALDVTD